MDIHTLFETLFFFEIEIEILLDKNLYVSLYFILLIIDENGNVCGIM